MQIISHSAISLYLVSLNIQIVLTDTAAISIEEVLEALEDKLEVVVVLRGVTGPLACTRAQELEQTIIGDAPHVP